MKGENMLELGCMWLGSSYVLKVCLCMCFSPPPLQRLLLATCAVSVLQLPSGLFVPFHAHCPQTNSSTTAIASMARSCTCMCLPFYHHVLITLIVVTLVHIPFPLFLSVYIYLSSDASYDYLHSLSLFFSSLSLMRSVQSYGPAKHIQTSQASQQMHHASPEAFARGNGELDSWAIFMLIGVEIITL